MEIISFLSFVQLSDFIIWGIIGNIIFSIITLFFYNTIIKKLSDSDYKIYIKFMQKRLQYAKNNNNPFVFALAFFAFLLPTYSIWINSILLFYLYKSPNLAGFINAIKKYDQFSIFQLVRYKTAKS